MLRAPAALALAALCLAARADDAAPYPLQVEVGKRVAICATGTIQCPAGAGACDEPAIAIAVATPEGLAFEGVKPGRTLCSAGASGGAGMRRVYAVTVVKPAPPQKTEEKGKRTTG